MKKINDIFKEISEVGVVKNNFGLITNFLIIIGLVLIIKLGFLGFWITTGGGGFIALGGPMLNYEFNKASLVSIILLLIFIIFYSKFLRSKNKEIKLELAVFILMLGLLTKQIFFVIAPEYRFHMTPVENQFVDLKGNINLNNFFNQYKKYCENDKYRVKIYGENYSCSFKANLKLTSVDQYIKVFEYAKENNFPDLYNGFYINLKNFGYEKLIKGYNDKTFYAYVIKGKWDNIKLMNLIKNNTNDEEIIGIINYIIDEINKYKINKENLNKSEIDFFWDNTDLIINQKIKEVNGINYNIF